MLDEKSRELLLGVRDRIESGKSQFICIALDDEARHLNGEGELGLPYSRCAAELKCEIAESLSQCYTLDSWLFSQTGYCPDDLSEDSRENWSEIAYKGWSEVSRKQFLNWCALARMAWIDRILETGEIE